MLSVRLFMQTNRKTHPKGNLWSHTSSYTSPLLSHQSFPTPHTASSGKTAKIGQSRRRELEVSGAPRQNSCKLWKRTLNDKACLSEREVPVLVSTKTRHGVKKKKMKDKRRSNHISLIPWPFLVLIHQGRNCGWELKPTGFMEIKMGRLFRAVCPKFRGTPYLFSDFPLSAHRLYHYHVFKNWAYPSYWWM